MEAPEPFSFEVRIFRLPPRATAEVIASGELDVLTGPSFRLELFSLLEAGLDVTMDLGKITFIDLAGLRALESAARRALSLGSTFLVTSPSRAVSRILEAARSAPLLLGGYALPGDAHSAN